MDVVDTRPDLVGVAVMLEGVEQLHVALRCLDGDDVGVKILNRRENVVEIRVAEVRVRLESVGDTRSSQLERGEGPRQVATPVGLAQRKL